MRIVDINTESIASALFLLGYDKIDPYLYLAVCANISLSKINDYTVELNGELYHCKNDFVSTDRTSKTFDSFVDFTFGIRPKEGCDKEQLTKFISSTNNKLLAQYIRNYIDLKKIMIEKIVSYKKSNIENFKVVFCDREKELLDEIFGIHESRTDKTQEEKRKIYKKYISDINSRIERMIELAEQGPKATLTYELK